MAPERQGHSHGPTNCEPQADEFEAASVAVHPRRFPPAPITSLEARTVGPSARITCMRIFCVAKRRHHGSNGRSLPGGDNGCAGQRQRGTEGFNRCPEPLARLGLQVAGGPVPWAMLASPHHVSPHRSVGTSENDGVNARLGVAWERNVSSTAIPPIHPRTGL
jgi:hypothetical protein